MKFNSIEFLVFLCATFFVLWNVRKNLKAFNILLLLVNYVFYAWWDLRFLLLILFSSFVDYTVGYFIPNSRHKKLLIGISLCINLGLLMFFKYVNFFIESFQDLLHQLNLEANYHTLNIILPVGISFYTFQTLSYSLDVYKGKVKPEKNIIAFLNYVSFFPQLIAGPIERATTFLPQFSKARIFNYPQAVQGLRLLLYGFFKKMVIADNLGIQIDYVYATYDTQNGFSLFFATALFFVQLYTDFSAYTDIARGVAKLLGFELVRNFKTPLFSRSIPEFWSRWHISLTNWFRDYFYLWFAGLYRKSTVWRILSSIILFVVIGFWHGANYTYIIFGFIHGISFAPRILSRHSKNLRTLFSFLKENKVASIFAMFGTYSLITISGVFFRSPNIDIAFSIYDSVFNNFGSSIHPALLKVSALAAGILAYEWITKERDHPFYVEGFHPYVRRGLYVVMTILILLYGYFGKEPFYYFQF